MYPSYKKSLACFFFSLIKSKSMAAPVINHQQQQLTWVPYETAKDCSQGFCSIYCPQWCSKIFPPPPPFSFFVDDDDDSSNNTAFSPLVITIIGILASAFLLISYYTIISKYCGGFRLLRRPHRNNNHNIPDAADDDDPVVESDVEDQSRSGRHGAWHVSASNGLDQALINKISVYRYKRGDGLVDGTDCSVCLSEFREEESLRLLPKCSHAFHLQCIDTWLGSHSNCPLCRANIVSVNSAPSQLPAAPPPPPLPPPLPILAAEGEGNDDAVVEMECLAQAEETNAESDENMSEHDAIDISDDGGGDAGSSPGGRVSIADILELSMEDEFTRAKERGILVGSGSSSRSSRGENSTSRSLHYVMSPVAMKRSVSSGRFGFPRQGKGRNTILPIPRNFENFDTKKIFPSFL